MKSLWNSKRVVEAVGILGLIVYLLPVSAQIIQVNTTDQFGTPVRVEINHRTGTSHRIWGSNPNIEKFGMTRNQLTNRNVRALANSVLASYKNLLKVDPSSLVVSQAETDGQNWYIAFEQRYKNLPVYGASAGITINTEGKIVSIGADAYPDVQVATAPDISEQQAEEVAKSDFTTADMDTVFRRSPNRLLIYPETSNNAIIYHLAYIVELQSNTPLKGLRYFIDAHSGAIIAKEGVFRDGSISGNVSGQYWPEQQNVNTSTEAPKYLSSLVVKNSIGQVVTTGTINSSGNYNLSWSANSGTFFLESKLQGSWIRVRNQGQNQDVIHTFQFTLPPTTVVHNFQFSAGNQGYNVYRHGNVVHDFFKGPPFYYNGMDYQMQANINAGPNENGRADGTNIFFGSQNGILWLGASDVVYHEYTHNTVYRLYGNQFIGSGVNHQGFAMDEGLSDYFAGTINGNSFIDLVNRNLSNNLRFPQNFQNGQPHLNGQIIGGAAWDLQQLLGTTTGRNLIFKALQMTPHAFNFTDFVNNVIIADDNNGTLCDNTPNTSQIRQAFETNHGISPTNLPTTLTASITGPTALDPGQAGTWTANPCPLSLSPFTYEWRFRVDGGSWSQVVGTGQTFSKSDFQNFELEAKITGQGQQAFAYYYVTVGGLPKTTDREFTAQLPLPIRFELQQNYPNPFNPQTEIRFGLPEDTHVRLMISDLLGRKIRNLVDSALEAGYRTVVWDGKDNSGNDVPSGIYLYRIVAGDFLAQKKLALVR